MDTTRRSFMLHSLAAGLAMHPLAGCAATPSDPDATKVFVLGTIHSTHRTSELYSLAVLEQAIRQVAPDIILTEIPPDRIDEAKRSFAETGEVAEERTRVFPEYTDVVFPLTREMDFRLFGTAGWTQGIARNRAQKLREFEEDPARADQWAEHLAARRNYSRELAGRGDDPRFIHTDEYDAIVARAQAPYQRYFDEDLGPGGWTQINRAHTDLIDAALDTVSGQGLTALITFGSWHKYMILRALAARNDISIEDSRALFT